MSRPTATAARLAVAALALTAAAVAQQVLPPGLWEYGDADEFGQSFVRARVLGDGSFTIESTATAGPALLALEGDEFGFLPDSIAATATGGGTWQVVGDSLHLTWDNLDVLVNGEPAADFLDRLVADLANALAADFEFTEEELTAFEEELAAMLCAQLGAEPLLVATPATHHFALDDNRFTLTPVDGDPVTFSRRVDLSAVQPLSWGQIKARP